MWAGALNHDVCAEYECEITHTFSVLLHVLRGDTAGEKGNKLHLEIIDIHTV